MFVFLFSRWGVDPRWPFWGLVFIWGAEEQIVSFVEIEDSTTLPSFEVYILLRELEAKWSNFGGGRHHDQALEIVERSIDAYNWSRPHMSCDMLTPAEAHQEQGPLKKHWKASKYNNSALRALAGPQTPRQV